MAKIIIECPSHLVESFCGWFSNQGEQDFMEAHACDQPNTYIATEGYGIDEPIRIVEYDKETDEEISYVD